jgi:hypothetical protein
LSFLSALPYPGAPSVSFHPAAYPSPLAFSFLSPPTRQGGVGAWLWASTAPGGAARGANPSGGRLPGARRRWPRAGSGGRRSGCGAARPASARTRGGCGPRGARTARAGGWRRRARACARASGACGSRRAWALGAGTSSRRGRPRLGAARIDLEARLTVGAGGQTRLGACAGAGW